MFTWICQKCGSEVPPSENDCPNCRARTAAASRADVAADPSPLVSSVGPSPIPPASAPITQPSPSPAYAPPPGYAPPPAAPELRDPRSIPLDPALAAPYEPPPAKGPSPTMVAIGSAVGILAVLAVLYLYVLPKNTNTAAVPSALEAPVAGGGAATTPAAAHPLAKYIEVTGLRISEAGRGQVKIGYVVVNHSPADLPELRTQLKLVAGGKDLFDIPATIPSIGPYESKDLSATVKTQLKPYELPDWQKLSPVLNIVGEK